MTHNKKVIPFPTSPVWTFWDFEQAIEDWYQQDLSEEAQEAFNALLKNNRKVERTEQWPGFRRFLNRVEEKIWELEFVADKRQYRLLCIFASNVAPNCWPSAMGSLRKQAVLLVGCYHKQRVYTPTNAIETAVKRAKALREGRAELRERKTQEDF